MENQVQIKASLLRLQPGVTVIELPQVYLSSNDNIVSVKQLLKDVVPDVRKGNKSSTKQKDGREKSEASKIKSDVVKDPIVSECDNSMDIENAIPNVDGTSSVSNKKSSAVSASAKIGNSVGRVGYGMNSFASFIEEMERKYTAHHLTIGSDSEDAAGGDFEASEDSSDESDDDGERETAPPTTLRKRRKHIEYYEYNDGSGDGEESVGFIDDSDLGNIVDEAYRSQNVRLRHSGFFVNSGELEVLPPLSLVPPNTEVGNGGTKIAASRPLGHATPADVTATEVSAINIENTFSKPKGRPRKSVSPVETHDPTTATASKVPIATKARRKSQSRTSTGGLNDLEHADLAGILPMSATWTAPPALSVLAPLNVSDVIVTASNPVVSPSIESDPMSATTVVSGAGTSVGTTSAKPYWTPSDATVRALGLFKAQAAYLRCDHLEKSVSLPLALEDPLRMLDQVVQQEHGTTLATQTGYLESISVLLGGKGVSVGKIKNFLNRIQLKVAAESALQALETAVARLAHSIRHATTSYVAKVKATEAGAEGGDDSDNAAPTAGNGSQLSAGNISTETAMDTGVGGIQAPTFKWCCRWSNVMKHALFQLEDLSAQWVVAENKKRAAMTVSEKRADGIEHMAPFDAKDHFHNSVLTKLCAIAFPDQCKNSDAASLRRIISAERALIKKKLLKAEAAAGIGQSGEMENAAVGVLGSNKNANLPVNTNGLLNSPSKVRKPVNSGAASPTASNSQHKKRPRTSAAGADTATTLNADGHAIKIKAVSKAPKRPFKSCEFVDIKTFDPDDFVEKASLAALGGGISPKRTQGMTTTTEVIQLL